MRITIIDGEKIDDLSQSLVEATECRLGRDHQGEAADQALARVEAQRERLVGQLSELEATERVLARHSKGARGGRAASAKTSLTETVRARRAGRRRTYGTNSYRKRSKLRSPAFAS